LLLISGAAAIALGMGGRLPKFVAGFPALYLLAWLSQVIAGNAALTTYGLEYVIFALVIGVVVGHTTSFGAWFSEAVQAEFYIKIGLIVMGAGILFSELVQIGAIGIVQAIIVVVSVWFFSFWLAKRLDVDDELATMMASAVSICGVSAAIAACGAIHGDRKKLSYVTSLVLIVAVPMLIVMPWIAKVSGMSPAVAGAWLGGTLDTSAAVVAAGELVGEQARNAAVVVKRVGCSSDKPTRPSVFLFVRGAVDSVSATAITVKPKDGSANQSCTVKNADQVKGIDTNDQVEMTCVQIAGAWTLAKVRERR